MGGRVWKAGSPVEMLRWNLGCKCVQGSIVARGRIRSLGRPAAASSQQRGNSEGSMACQKSPSGARCSLWTSSPSIVGSGPPGEVEPLGWTSLAKSCAARAPVEGSSADCPAAGDKLILEEGIAVQCKEHGIKGSGRSGIHRIHSVFPVGRADSACQWEGLSLRARNLLVLLFCCEHFAI